MAAAVPCPNDPSSKARAAIKHRQQEDIEVEDHDQAIDALTGGHDAMALIPRDLQSRLIPDALSSQDVTRMPQGTVPALHALTQHANGNIELIHYAIELAILDRPVERKLTANGQPGIPPLTAEDVLDAFVNILRDPQLNKHLNDEYVRGHDDGYADCFEDMKRNIATAIHASLRGLWSRTRTVATVSIIDFVNGVVERTWSSLKDRPRGESSKANKKSHDGNDGSTNNDERAKLDTDAGSFSQGTSRSFSMEEAEKLIRQSYRKGQASVFSVVENLKRGSCEEGKEGAKEEDFDIFAEKALRPQASKVVPAEDLRQSNEDPEGLHSGVGKAELHEDAPPEYLTVEAALKLTTSKPERLAVPRISAPKIVTASSEDVADETDRAESSASAHGHYPEDVTLESESPAASSASEDITATDAHTGPGNDTAVGSACLANEQEISDEDQQGNVSHELPQLVQRTSSASATARATTPERKVAQDHDEGASTTETRVSSVDGSLADHHIAEDHDKTTPPRNDRTPSTATSDSNGGTKVAKATESADHTPSRNVDGFPDQLPNTSESASSASSASFRVISRAAARPLMTAGEEPPANSAHQTPRPKKRARESGRGVQSPSDGHHDTPDGKKSRLSNSPAEDP